MWSKSFWTVLKWLLALLSAAIVTPASAAATSEAAACFHSGPADQDLAALVASNLQWDCDRSGIDVSQQRTVLRFELGQPGKDANKTPPRFVVSRAADFHHLSALALDLDGSMRELSYDFGDVEPGLPGLQFSAELPAVNPDTKFVYIAVDGAAQRIVFDQLTLVDTLPGNSPADHDLMLLLAVLCGMIMMPLAFNLAFYRVLRQPFLLWHLLLSSCAIIQITLTAGFFAGVVNLSMELIRGSIVLSLGGMIIAASMFAASYIEPDKLSPRLRKMLVVGAFWTGLVTLVHACSIDALGRYSSDFYYIGSAMMLPLFAVVIFSALRRGSRAAWFQLVGWTPLFIAGTIRVVSYFVPGMEQSDAHGLFHLGVAVECIATALGVADRFMNIRQQRDRAMSEARISEALSERDHLTGLMNRRAIEPRFAELRSQGFDTFALIDLDRFKAVNDMFGHAVGDDVLCAVAHALEPDDDVKAMRLGGEEFVLLLRGDDAKNRAERRRMAIPARVSFEVAGLDRLVTASMGLIELPQSEGEHATFNELYTRADRLLYEAKEAGRNRGMFERVMAFPERRISPRPGRSVSA